VVGIKPKLISYNIVEILVTMVTMLSVHGGSTVPTYEYNYESVETITIQIKTPIIEEVKEEVIAPSISVLCNCYAYVKQTFTDLPRTKTILNNLSESGEVAVFYYPSSGVHHYAVVTHESEDSLTISETNFKTCKKTERTISKDYSRLLGFYSVG